MVHVVGERMKVENILYCCVRVKYALSPVTSQRAPHYLERWKRKKKEIVVPSVAYYGHVCRLRRLNPRFAGKYTWWFWWFRTALP